MAIFKFYKIGNHTNNDWLCLVNTIDALKIVFEVFSKESLVIWRDIQNSNPDMIGHCRTKISSTIKTIFGFEMENGGIKEIPFEEGIKKIVKIRTETFLNIYVKEGSVYVNRNGGCRSPIIFPDREKILDEYESDEFVFPEIEDKNIKIEKWLGGKHFYLISKDEKISVGGIDKWNTIEAAERAKNTYIKESRFKVEEIKNV